MQSLPNTPSPSTGPLAAPAFSFVTFGATPLLFRSGLLLRSDLLLPSIHLAILR